MNEFEAIEGDRLFSSTYCVQTIHLHCVSVLNLWILFDMVMMWVEVLLSVGAQCD